MGKAFYPWPSSKQGAAWRRALAELAEDRWTSRRELITAMTDVVARKTASQLLADAVRYGVLSCRGRWNASKRRDYREYLLLPYGTLSPEAKAWRSVRPGAPAAAQCSWDERCAAAGAVLVDMGDGDEPVAVCEKHGKAAQSEGWSLVEPAATVGPQPSTRDRVVDALRRADGWLTVEALRGLVGGQYQTLLGAVDELAREGEIITRTARGGREVRIRDPESLVRGFLKDHPDSSLRTVRGGVPLRHAETAAVLGRLVTRGVVTACSGPRSARLFRCADTSV